MMKLRVFLFFFSFLSLNMAHAQRWTLFGGIGAGYDGFIRDKSVMPDKSKWPFEVDPELVVGLAYQPFNGFESFVETTLGIASIQYPVPDMGSTRTYYSQLQGRFTLGSGPKLKLGDNNVLVPYIVLGATYLNDWKSNSSQSGDVVTVYRNNPVSNNTWAVIGGGGIDWQVSAKFPSSLNLQCTYTPINIFAEPVNYQASTVNNNYDLMLQGKLLQFMLSFRVHWHFGKVELEY